MARTTSSTTACMNTGSFVRESRHYKTRNNPILNSKMIIFKDIKVVK